MSASAHLLALLEQVASGAVAPEQACGRIARLSVASVEAVKKIDLLPELIADARADEREQCARIADECVGFCYVAERIRARGDAR
jgi:hypothetical protein